VRPNPKLHNAKLTKLLACESKNMGIAHKISKMPKTGLPPYLSVKIPAGSRNIEPVSTGIPKSHPISIGPQSKTWFPAKKVTNTPFSIQHAKHTVNAIVFKAKIRCARPVTVASMVYF
jgi:hypothetical protein